MLQAGSPSVGSPPPTPPMPAPSQAVSSAPSGAAGLFKSLFRKTSGRANAPAPRQSETAEEILLDLASRMDSDGGMPGPDAASRAAASIIALIAFVSQGHTTSTGAFRSHVMRLFHFLRSLGGLSRHRQLQVAAIVQRVEEGNIPPGDWLGLALKPGDHWKEVMKLVP